jgi:hypothetical protein
MALELPPDFKDLFRLFNANQVEYLLIGGYAVIIHGYVRATADVDVAVACSTENASRCVRALEEFGFSDEALDERLFLCENRNVVRLGFPPIKIEILNYLEGVDFEKAYARRLVIGFEDVPINVISLTDLLANKRAIGRTQDIADIEKLIERNDV